MVRFRVSKLGFYAAKQDDCVGGRSQGGAGVGVGARSSEFLKDCPTVSIHEHTYQQTEQDIATGDATIGFSTARNPR